VPIVFIFILRGVVIDLARGVERTGGVRRQSVGDTMTHAISYTVARMAVGERITGLTMTQARRYAAEGWRVSRRLRESRVYYRGKWAGGMHYVERAA
jgi:hypothetical protein